MILAIDVGNSHIVIGMVENGEIRNIVRFHTDPRETATEHIIKLRQITDFYGLDPTSFEGSILSSVVPRVTEPLKTALENLISNAVNYTPDGGNIAIDIDNRSFTVKNTAEMKIDASELTMPFKKGDKARSKRTSGLGLSLAQKAAEQNGFKLRLSSDKDSFTAKIVI